ncbi:hypothetical protein Q0590_11410 [Rhodocytophaga aerolata]|uniref:Uncharacterized protein n=1 Tax=Rhodocytophaga aerolata TaxID=455078 RepID=A0ABT8R448_9BACT|nr:hypothetical protein [Rhodocytophaga aerolata]MDO1446865.1 hypothetical protein [Rhodocytophaga aerolata]
MKLKKGITGFYNHAHDTIPKLDRKSLKDCAYNCTYSTDYRLEKILNPDQTSNYYRMSYKHCRSNEKIDVVVNSHYPYFAGINPESSWMNLEFVSLPKEISQAFEEAGFIYLTPQVLTAQFDKKDLEELSQNELQQIVYWKSKTFGEVIYNGYD